LRDELEKKEIEQGGKNAIFGSNKTSDNLRQQTAYLTRELRTESKDLSLLI